MFVNRVGAYTAEQTVAVLGELAQVAIDLGVPEWKSCLMGEIFGLIQKPAAQTAGINFLQSDQIEGVNQLGYPVQICHAFTQWQKVLPALGDVLMKFAGLDTGLDIKTK